MMNADTSKTKKEKTADQVMDWIMDMLVDGTLKMGDRLNAEQIAKTHEVSRMPVREALTVLEQKGLAVYVPNCGMRLAELSNEEVIEIYRFRQIVESRAAAYACRFATESDIAYVEQCYNDHVAALTDPSVNPKLVHKANRKFHKAIFAAAHKKYFADNIDRAWDILGLVKMLYGTSFLASEENKAMLMSEHRMLLDYLKARNASAMEYFVQAMIEDKIRIFKQQNNIIGEDMSAADIIKKENSL